MSEPVQLASEGGRRVPRGVLAAFVVALLGLVAIRTWGGSTPADVENAVDAPSLRFTDVTSEAGLDEPHSATDLFGESAMTAGVAVNDVDRDGDLDVFLTRIGRPNRLMINDGTGRFTDVAEAAHVAGHGGGDGSSAAAFADVDTDGDDDLVVTGSDSAGVTLYVNEGLDPLTFRDATPDSGLDALAPREGASAQLHGVTFSDYDRDGRLDLLVTNWDETVPAALADAPAGAFVPDEDGRTVCSRARWLAENDWPRPPGSSPNRGRLFHNDGAGRFRDVTEQVGLPFGEVMGFTGRFVDVDADGWDDLLVTGDFCTSRLFRNVGGERFEDMTADARVATDENGMGSVIEDFDGDGTPDWFITSIGPVGDDPAPLQLGGFGSSGNRLFLNNGHGQFDDATDDFGVRNGGWGWGAAFEDFDNDGRRSLVMTNGYSVSADDTAPAAADPMRFWYDGGEGFTEIASSIGLDDSGLGRGLVAFDMDRDGDLDLLVADFGAEPHLYRNDSPAAHWLDVRLDDQGSPGNPEGIGSKVVVTGSGGATTRWMVGGGSYESQIPAELHFGRGDSDQPVSIEVWWPGESAPQTVENVVPDRMVNVTRR